ncbi:MAG TPA: 1-(5-phosphoribosyl)-5-[(5-phosphoribosylamino)methylideneamino]imidazole-4-carboxamide isomerase [Deltaproteobacteria bacterium]|nr:1-(5-phosphoribosyl)-5-[(5-phosphoribosylamino)methylideneamino]imidazole-4-carboxamide isomerase [Candidatus Binatota bacterium]HIL12511.1 1-(5-phosphoribosyl)-5-[(5-phosphoribosylamino)methylideneamino]imidazole-4-carboxamide isomerase [Deltaproteobacteria bacterium]
MLVLPAIDIRAGRCVRLLRGDYEQETVFSDDPAAMAQRWIDEGARALHLVDLDGARGAGDDNQRAVEAILAVVAGAGDDFITELGGGIRDLVTVERWLEAGVGRVILGTVAVRAPDIVEQAARRWPGRVWVGIDARSGRVAVDGWLNDGGCDALELAMAMQDAGVAGIVYTDIDRDGTGDGVNAEATARLARSVTVPVVASGGVHGVADVERLREVAGSGIDGVVVGRALYDGAVTLARLTEAAG